MKANDTAARNSAIATFAALLFAALLGWSWNASAQVQPAAPELTRPQVEVPGITPEVLVRTTVPGAPGKIAITTRMTYHPGARNRKHYHTSQVVFYILEGAMVVQDDGKEQVTLKAGDTLLVKPGTVHTHWNASTTAKLVFAEFILLDEGQRSTVAVEP